MISPVNFCLQTFAVVRASDESIHPVSASTTNLRHFLITVKRLKKKALRATVGCPIRLAATPGEITIGNLRSVPGE